MAILEISILTGEVLNRYASMEEASDALGVSIATIESRCAGALKNKSRLTYLRYEDDVSDERLARLMHAAKRQKVHIHNVGEIWI